MNMNKIIWFIKEIVLIKQYTKIYSKLKES